MGKLFVVVLAALSLFGCVGIEVSKSDFDGSTHIQTRYGSCENGVKMLLSWNSNMRKDLVRLDVYNKLRVPAGGESLEFNVDGRRVALAANGPVVIDPQSGMLEQSYMVSPNLIDDIIQARKVMYRLYLSSDYVEGKLIDDPAGAVTQFKEFMEAFRQGGKADS